mmetsp:Transcript_5202/g.15817  ORF Transcript_5202/g.15817 Transcript_5202/m.15817 type:complete len:215 (+) Transcript_5202:719-1363(+)
MAGKAHGRPRRETSRQRRVRRRALVSGQGGRRRERRARIRSASDAESGPHVRPRHRDRLGLRDLPPRRGRQHRHGHGRRPLAQARLDRRRPQGPSRQTPPKSSPPRRLPRLPLPGRLQVHNGPRQKSRRRPAPPHPPQRPARPLPLHRRLRPRPPGHDPPPLHRAPRRALTTRSFPCLFAPRSRVLGHPWRMCSVYVMVLKVRDPSSQEPMVAG